jgi:acyl-coenzyme A thioesterase PaaI-like protein
MRRMDAQLVATMPFTEQIGVVIETASKDEVAGHVGRTTIVAQTEVRDANDKLVALVTQTQAVLRG